jgi:hypothetical protein
MCISRTLLMDSLEVLDAVSWKPMSDLDSAA